MLALSLGVAWLLLAPLCLWLLVKGSTSERAGAIATLALLEAGTIAMNSLIAPSLPVRPASAQALPAPASIGRPAASCDERAPTPHSARIGRELVLTWPATAPQRQCMAAEAVLRPRGRKLLVWLYETQRTGEHRAALTTRHQTVFALPVQVRNGTVTLKIPLPEKSGFIPTDGHTGRSIPPPAR